MEKSHELAHAFGAFVKSQRRIANISQRELAKASGVSDSYLSQLERGLYSPSIEVLQGISRALELSPATVLAQFGGRVVDDEPQTDPADVEAAIRRDPALTAAKKDALLTVYRALRDSPDDVGAGDRLATDREWSRRYQQ